MLPQKRDLGELDFAPGFSPITSRRAKVLLKMAAPPKYDLLEGEVVYTEMLCSGSELLRIRSDSAVDYQPGHVIALHVKSDDSVDPEGEGENKGKHGDGTKGP